MGFRAVEWAYGQEVTPAGKKSVLVALAWHADDEDRTCFPGQERLARLTGQSVRAVRTHLEALEKGGWIRRTRRHRRDGSRTSDSYLLLQFDSKDDDGSTGEILRHDRKKSTAQPEDLARNPSEEPLVNQTADSPPESVPNAALRPRHRDIPPSIEGSRVSEVAERLLDIIDVREVSHWQGQLGRVRKWLDEGFDPEIDIYPSVTRLMARRKGRPPNSIRYFEAAIADAYAQRTQPVATSAHFSDQKGETNDTPRQQRRADRDNDRRSQYERKAALLTGLSRANPGRES